MKIMCVLASARRKGNTATVLGWVAEQLRAGGHGVVHVFVGDGRVKPCTACNARMCGQGEGPRANGEPRRALEAPPANSPLRRRRARAIRANGEGRTANAAGRPSAA